MWCQINVISVCGWRCNGNVGVDGLIKCTSLTMVLVMYLLLSFVEVGDPHPVSGKHPQRKVELSSPTNFTFSSISSQQNMLQPSKHSQTLKETRTNFIRFHNSSTSSSTTSGTTREDKVGIESSPMKTVASSPEYREASPDSSNIFGKFVRAEERVTSSLEKGRPSTLLELERSQEKLEDKNIDLNSNSQLVIKLDRNYTPKQIAEYIYSTGDEKGITQAVGEMLEDGQFMGNRDNAILFLEKVQMELERMKKRNKKMMQF